MLQADLNAVQASGDIVGLLATVDTPDGRIRARAGTTTIDGDDRMPWNAEFRIASTTKTFVSTVVLQLVDEGVLSLDDTVEKWLPGLVTSNGNDGATITISFHTRTGVTDDGTRSVVVSLRSAMGEDTSDALNTLVDHALC